MQRRPPTKIKELLQRTFDEWNRHNAAQLGASLSYYATLSLAPMLIMFVAIIGMVYGPDAAQGSLNQQLERFMGYQAATAVQHVVASTSNPSSGTVASILGGLMLLVGASSVAIALQNALNLIWDVPPRPVLEWWMPYVRQRLVGFVTVVIAGFLLVLSLGVTTAIAAVEEFFSQLLPVPAFVLQLVNTIVSLAVTTGLFAVIFRTLPDRKIAWRRVWVGAAFTALLFTLGRYVIGIYLGKAGVGSAYGAAGSLIVVLVWVYYSAQVVLFGAEFTHVYAEAQAANAREHSRESQSPVPNP